MNKLKLDLSASLEILKKSKFFNEVELNHLKTIASYSDYISVEKDEVLFNAGEKHSAGIFYLISGKVNLYTLEGDNDLEIVREVYENEIFNSLSIFYEKNRSNTALTSEQSSLLFIPKESLVDLGEKHFNFNKILHEKITIEFNLEKLLRILSKVYSKEVDHGIFRKIINLG